MGLAIAAGAMGVMGMAGGIMGGMQKGAADQANFLAQEAQTNEANFLGAMAHDRQTEAMAQQNVNARLAHEGNQTAALQNSFYSSWQATKQFTDNKRMIDASSRAATATLHSQMTGQLGSASGGTAKLMAKQTAQASLDAAHANNMKKYENDKQIAQTFSNQLNQSGGMGLNDEQSSAFIAGNSGIAPSKSGAMLSGIMGGASSGLGMAGGIMAFGS